MSFLVHYRVKSIDRNTGQRYDYGSPFLPTKKLNVRKVILKALDRPKKKTHRRRYGPKGQLSALQSAYVEPVHYAMASISCPFVFVRVLFCLLLDSFAGISGATRTTDPYPLLPRGHMERVPVSFRVASAAVVVVVVVAAA